MEIRIGGRVLYGEGFRLRNGIFQFLDQGCLDSQQRAVQLSVEMEIGNFSLSDCRGIDIACTVKDAQGCTVAEKSTSLNALLLPGNVTGASMAMLVGQPHLWDVEDPYLYTVTATLSCNGEARDQVEIRTGIRTVEFTPDNGLLLNGKRIQLKGVNLHQDHAGVGAAITDELIIGSQTLLLGRGEVSLLISADGCSPVRVQL